MMDYSSIDLNELAIAAVYSSLLLFLLYFAFSLLTYVCMERIWSKRSKTVKFRRALLVVAHPDDECMFFGPTLMNLVRSSPEYVYILCLSAGGFGGNAIERKKEFWRSCQAMGIHSSNIMLVNCEKMQDDPNREWPSPLIRDNVLSFVKSYDIDLVVTFDQYGVSGHKNHCAIFETVKELIDLGQWPPSCKVFALESINIFRKYVLTLLDVWYSFLTCKTIYLASPFQRRIIKSAMHQHVSQVNWYRKLYLIFSRYMFVNTLYELTTDEKGSSGDTFYTPTKTD